AERMRRRVEASPSIAEGVKVSVTISIGGSLKDRMEDINLSIKAADAALYRAKQAGRNRTVLDWMGQSEQTDDRIAS
ncbi:MAG: diguanylate cyclase, partial [Pseudomonadota bacterium]